MGGSSSIRILAEGAFKKRFVRSLTWGVMAHPSTLLFLLAAVAFAAPDVGATPVQGLRGTITNSTGEARHLSDPGDDVESGGGKTCCKNGDDTTNCVFIASGSRRLKC